MNPHRNLLFLSDYKFSKCSSKNSPIIAFFNQLDDPCFDPKIGIWKFSAGWNLIFAIKLEECWGYDFETDFCSSGPTQVLKFSSGLYLALNAAFAVISLNHSAINFQKKDKNRLFWMMENCFQWKLLSYQIIICITMYFATISMPVEQLDWLLPWVRSESSLSFYLQFVPFWHVLTQCSSTVMPVNEKLK